MQDSGPYTNEVEIQRHTCVRVGVGKDWTEEAAVLQLAKLTIPLDTFLRMLVPSEARFTEMLFFHSKLERVRRGE